MSYQNQLSLNSNTAKGAKRCSGALTMGIPLLSLTLLAVTLQAQFDPRTQTTAKGGDKGSAGLRDDGYGMCPAFSHYHPTVDDIGRHPNELLPWVDTKENGTWPALDGLCHRDSDDAAIKDRKVLPKPFKPDPKQKLT
jgi:hypothetical protein